MTRGTPIQPGRWTGWIDGDDGSDAQLSGKPHRRGKPEAVVADPDAKAAANGIRATGRLTHPPTTTPAKTASPPR